MKSEAKIEEGFLKAPDGTELFYYTLSAKRPKGTIVIVHGLDEHSGRYRHFAEHMVGEGWRVYLYDQRGHARSHGTRCFANSMRELAGDLDTFVEWVKVREEGGKIFLLAHSFGGQVAINYLAEYTPDIRGVVFSAPNVKLALPVPALKKIVGRWLSNFLPRFQIPNDVKPEYVSRDPKVVEAYRNDPYLQQKISLKLGAAILDNLETIMEMAQSIQLPCLMLHGGEDKITAKEGSEIFFRNLASKDKKLKIYPDFYHEILNERGKEKVYRDIVEWLEERV